jgi:hypothetical protein
LVQAIQKRNMASAPFRWIGATAATKALFDHDRKAAEHPRQLVQMPGIMRCNRVCQTLHAFVIAESDDRIANRRPGRPGRGHNLRTGHRITSMTLHSQVALPNMIAQSSPP